MSKKGKKRDVLGGRTDKQRTENPRGVVTSAKVGKGQPPEAFKWKPGQSGNPSGKASEAHEVTVGVIRAVLAEVDPKLRKSNLERIVRHMTRRGLQGSYKDIKLLLAYGLGQPQQAMNLDVVNYTDAVTRMRAARQLEQADATITKYFHERSGNGHSTPQEARAAALLADQDLSQASEDDAERPAEAKPKITVEL